MSSRLQPTPNKHRESSFALVVLKHISWLLKKISIFGSVVDKAVAVTRHYLFGGDQYLKNPFFLFTPNSFPLP